MNKASNSYRKIASIVGILMPLSGCGNYTNFVKDWDIKYSNPSDGRALLYVMKDDRLGDHLNILVELEHKNLRLGEKLKLNFGEFIAYDLSPGRYRLTMNCLTPVGGRRDQIFGRTLIERTQDREITLEPNSKYYIAHSDFVDGFEVARHGGALAMIGMLAGDAISNFRTSNSSGHSSDKGNIQKGRVAGAAGAVVGAVDGYSKTEIFTPAISCVYPLDTKDGNDRLGWLMKKHPIQRHQ